MERKIGEVFDFNGVSLQVVETKGKPSCQGCYFDDSEFGCVTREFINKIKSCYEGRSDKNSVIFKKI